MKLVLSVLVVALSLSLSLLGGCGGQEEPLAPRQTSVHDGAGMLAKSTFSTVSISPEMLDAVNAALQGQGKRYRVGFAESITDLNSGQVGQIVYAKDVGNKQKDADFVAFDPRRTWSGPIGGSNDDITYAIDQKDAKPAVGGLTGVQTTAAIVAAMQTWSQVSCANLPLRRVSDGGKDLGVAASALRLGGSNTIAADIMHAGFTDIDFGDFVLGVTFTYFFADGGGVTGEPSQATDIDNNGKLDVAFREIYYDKSTIWKVSPSATIVNGDLWVDVQSIALHEAGHGLSQGHFGFLFTTDANGMNHLAPLAVMNAGYTGMLQELLDTDIAGHCSIWSYWPIH